MTDGKPIIDDNPMEKYLKKKGSFPVMAIVKGIIGAVIGAAIGHFAIEWIVPQGLYPLPLPGALMGLGFGMGSRYPSLVCGIICGGIAFMQGCYYEWRFHPFIADESFSYFMSHLHQVIPINLILIILSGVLGFWFARSR